MVSHFIYFTTFTNHVNHITLFSLCSQIKRYKIIGGIAKAIIYLHHSRLSIRHCDFKAGNILIDAETKSKVTDFGLAKFLEWTNL